MPNKNTFLQCAIKDIDHKEHFWFIDTYSAPEAIVEHLFNNSNKDVSTDKLTKTNYDAKEEKNFTIVFHSISLNCLCAWISCPLSEEHQTTQEIINLLRKKVSDKKIEVYITRT